MRTTQKQGRARGRGQRKPGNGNVLNRVYESSGPEGKVRGTPQQIVDKYLGLARDAQTAGDRVTSENFLQHAEHYQRILTQAAQQQQSERREQAESEAEAAAEPAAQANGAGSGKGVEGFQTIEAEGESGDLLVEDDRPAQEPKKPRSRRKAAPEPAGEDGETATRDGNGHDTGTEQAEAEPKPARQRRSRSRDTAKTDTDSDPSSSSSSEASAGNG